MKIKIILTLLLALTLNGCIYEDGPKFSLRSKEARMINTWYIDKVYEEGVDKTDDYKSVYVNYKLDLKSDKNYDLSYKAGNLLNYSESGTWKLSDDKTKLLYTPKNGKESSWTILRLKNSEFWAEMSLNNKNVKIYFKD
jgi:hypothetical protein